MKLKINEQLKNRLKSLAWRVGMMVVAAVLQFILDNATDLNISPLVTVFVGLILGEVTKFLNTSKVKK